MFASNVDTSHVLAVDDSPDNLFLIKTILDEEEYCLTCVESGREALQEVQQSPPDLILLDIMMPDMNGYEVTRKLRKDVSLPYIPILLVTAHNHTSLVEGLDAGADDFIRKPFDIEELQARMRSLLRLKRAIDEQANMICQRDDFVARLTHDLRTPMIAANRMLQFCKEEAFGRVADEAKTAIAETIQNNEQLLNMVNTLLEVYRHEAGHKALSEISLNLYEIAAAVVNELQPLAEDKQLDLKLIGYDGKPVTDIEAFRIRGDAMELRRVITNLVGNAIKFTDQGYIHLQFDQTTEVPLQSDVDRSHKHSGWIMLKIIDTGVGMSSEDQAEIFKWFRQGRQRRAGSGLGLHLADRIVAMHGGEICVESVPSEGSTFTVYLPKRVAN